MNSPQHKHNLCLSPATNNHRKISPSLLTLSLRKDHFPHTHTHYFKLAKQYLSNRNDIHAAIQNFQVCLESDPNHLECLYLCGIAYINLQDYHKGIKKLITYLNVKKNPLKNLRRLAMNNNLPAKKNVVLIIAIAYKHLKMFTKSLEYVNMGIKMDQGFKQGYCLRAKLYMLVGHAQKSLQDYLKIFKVDNQFVPAYIGIGDYYLSCHKYKIALKNYEKAKQLSSQVQINKQQSNLLVDRNYYWVFSHVQIDIKIAIVLIDLNQLQKSKNILNNLLTIPLNSYKSETYYYLALAQLKSLNNSQIQKSQYEKIKINLQFSVKEGNNKSIMEKACKLLIKILSEHKQFYEIQRVVKLADQVNIHLGVHKLFFESCMMAIKHRYSEALPILKKLFGKIMQKKQTIHLQSIKEDQKYDRFEEYPQGIKDEAIQKKFSLNFQSIKSPKKQFQSPCRSQFFRKSRKGNGEFTLKLAKLQEKDQIMEDMGDLEWMKKPIMLFKAYCQFFMQKFADCYETYEVYEKYVSEYLGEEIENDINLMYNKKLCQALINREKYLISQCFTQLDESFQNMLLLNETPHCEPLVYRVSTMLHMVLKSQIQGQVNNKQHLLNQIINLISDFLIIVGDNYLLHYYQALTLYCSQKYQKAAQALQKCLKSAEQWSWKYLYVKGMIEVQLGNYEQAIKQFSGGLLLQERPQLYIGRCFCYIYLSLSADQDEQEMVDNSHKDFTKFIHLEQDKQKIDIFVTKVFYLRGIYEEAEKHYIKIPPQKRFQDSTLENIGKYINFFKGNFEDAGIIGAILINAFEGIFKKGFLFLGQQTHQLCLQYFFQYNYGRWLQILNIYMRKEYEELQKYLKAQIQHEIQQQQLVQLKFNLAVVYYLKGETEKADKVIQQLNKHYIGAQQLIDKVVNRGFSNDQCVNGLQQVDGKTRISSFLPYRKAIINEDLCIFLKISIPFPQLSYPKPLLYIQKQFILKQTQISEIPKKIEAPWMRRIKNKKQFQFTEQINQSINFSSIQKEGSCRMETIRFQQKLIPSQRLFQAEKLESDSICEESKQQAHNNL